MNIKIKSILILFLATLFFVIKIPLSHGESQMAAIASLDSDVKILKNGKVSYNIKIIPYYFDILDWNLGLKSIDRLVIKADGVKLKSRDYTVVKQNGYQTIKSKNRRSAAAWEISFTSNDAFSVNSRDNFRWLAVIAGHPFIENVNINLQSDIPFEETDRQAYRLYAFHGVESSTANMMSKNQINYQGTILSPPSGFSVFASWPRGTIKFPILKRLIFTITNLSIMNWIFFGLLLPAISMVILIILFVRYKTQIIINSTREIKETPPFILPPLQVGILVDKKIFPKTLMATILDLCEKGYLVIIKDKNQIVFAKRKLPDDNLRDWEKNLIEEITLNNLVWARISDLKNNVNRNLFSPQIKACYEEAYLSVTNAGYFDQNPHLVRVRYKIYAILLYLAAVMGLIWVAISMGSSYLLVPLLGVLFATMIVIKFAYLLPVQNKKGLLARKEWMKFGNYLKSKEDIQSIMAIGGVFYKYLPYALVLNVEKDWARRFHNTVMIKPDWLLEREVTDVESENTLHEVLGVIEKMTGKISQLHGPNVK